jgi:hypothetical protein
MLPVLSVIPLRLSLGWSRPQTKKIRQTTILPGRILSIHVATSLVL